MAGFVSMILFSESCRVSRHKAKSKFMDYPQQNEKLQFFDSTVEVVYAGIRKDGRHCVYYKFPNGKFKSAQYARYLMENYLQKYLDTDECVDHIDRDKTNDSLENLRVVPRRQSTMEDLKYVQAIAITCVYCGKQALKAARQLNHSAKQNKAGPFCSKSCVGKYGSSVQNEHIKPFPAQLEVPIEKRTYLYADKDTGTIPMSLPTVKIPSGMVEITCLICHQIAMKSFSWLNGNAKLGKAGPFCGQSCASKYTRGIQTGKMEKLPPQRVIDPDEIK